MVFEVSLEVESLEEEVTMTDLALVGVMVEVGDDSTGCEAERATSSFEERCFSLIRLLPIK